MKYKYIYISAYFTTYQTIWHTQTYPLHTHTHTLRLEHIRKTALVFISHLCVLNVCVTVDLLLLFDYDHNISLYQLVSKRYWYQNRSASRLR